MGWSALRASGVDREALESALHTGWRTSRKFDADCLRLSLLSCPHDELACAVALRPACVVTAVDARGSNDEPKEMEMLAVMRLLIWAMLLWTVPLAVARAAPDKALEPGTYIRSGDTGALILRRSSAGALEFELETLGSNGHICSAGGQVRGSVAIAPVPDEDSPPRDCRLELQVQGSRVRTSVLTEEACMSFCGARAWLGGDFRRPPTACKRSTIAQRRALFLKQYRAKQHAEAVQTAQGLLAECKDFLFWITQDGIRSDLALAQLRAGQPQACLATLEQTAAGKVADQEGLREALPPLEYDIYEWANAIWHNRRLCQQAISSSAMRQDQGRNGPGAARP